MNIFQQAKVTQGIPTQKPNKTPFFEPKYSDAICVVPIGITVSIKAIIKSLYIYGGFFIKQYFLYP